MSETARDSLRPAEAESEIRSRIDSLSYLPASVGVALKLMELGKKPDADPAEYARVITGDPGLYAKLLSLSNSSFFGVNSRVTKPQMAVSLLGLATVRTLSLAYCLAGMHNHLQLSPADSRPFWAGSLLKAVAAKQFASALGSSYVDEAFAVGMLQDIASPVMFSVNRSAVGDLFNNADMGAEERLDCERKLFQHDHMEFGRLLARKLNLPPLYISLIGAHHHPDQLSGPGIPPALAQATYVASLFPRKMDRWNTPDACALKDFFETQVPALAGNALIEIIEIEFRKLYAYFHEGYAPATRILEMLIEATVENADNTTRLVGTAQELMRDIASAGKDATIAGQEEARLEHQAHTDPLTGALNREGLKQQATDMIRLSKRLNQPYAILFIDLDHFKKLNDRVGHDAGDVALQQVVATMRRSTRSTDCTARVGGDEFVIAMGQCDYPSAMTIAERVITNITRTQIGGGGVTIAASAGLVCVQPNDAQYTLEELLRMTDKLMYAAKRDGGGRFTHTRLIGNKEVPFATSAQCTR